VVFGGQYRGALENLFGPDALCLDAGEYLRQARL
jgi:hypothetical protein